MLKRLRPPTPPAHPVFEPSETSASSNGVDAVQRLVKRRRVQGPYDSAHIEQDDEEDDNEEVQPLGQSTPPRYQQDSQGEYTRANSLLHELHTLHHHRAMFSNPAPSHPSRKETSLSTSGSSWSYPQKTLAGLPSQTFTSPSPNIVEESERVTKTYEDTNRLLGSLVLMRRRHLEIPENDDF